MIDQKCGNCIYWIKKTGYCIESPAENGKQIIKDEEDDCDYFRAIKEVVK